MRNSWICLICLLILCAPLISGDNSQTKSIYDDYDWGRILTWDGQSSTYGVGSGSGTAEVVNYSVTSNYNGTIPQITADIHGIGAYRANCTLSISYTNGTTITIMSNLTSGVGDYIAWLFTNPNPTEPIYFMKFGSVDDHYDTLYLRNVKFNITYNTPNITIYEPTGTGTSLNVSYNISIISNETRLSACYYNITRGASTEISTTKASFNDNNQSVGTFVVSGYGIAYDFHFWCNNTKNLGNTQSSAFNVGTPTSPSGGGGGGGAYIPFTNQTFQAAKTCLKYEKPFKDAWGVFWADTSSTNFKNLLKSFWNTAFCGSGASIVPFDR